MSALDHQESEVAVEAAADVAYHCKTYAWTPEVHDLYGDAESILRKIDGMEMNLGDRRVFLLVVAGENGGEVRFFEQVDAENWAVLTWRGDDLGDLHARIAQTVLSNRGVHCVGEQVKAMLGDAVTLELQGVVPAPSSPRAAFAHTLRAHGGGTFIRATMALLC